MPEVREPQNPRRAAWTSRRSTVLAFVSLLACGCAVRFHPPVDAREALANIERNYSRIQGALSCKPARISARFRDPDGRTQRVFRQEATVIFAAPGCLYLDIKALSGSVSVARIGSNDQRYWFWVDLPDVRKLAWGTWAALVEGRSRPLIIPPNLLLDALLLRAPPTNLPNGPPPLLITENSRRRLLFQVYDEAGWPYVARVMDLDQRHPYLPVQISDYLPDGRTAMRARLGRYRRVTGSGPDGPYTPRRYDVRWDVADAAMQLRFDDVRYREKHTPFCEFPASFRGEVECLDQAPLDSLQGAEKHAEEGPVVS